jgi:hypothetical protein
MKTFFKKTKSFTIPILACLLVVLLSAFGCKQAEPTKEEAVAEPTEEVTFAPPEPTVTNEAAPPTTEEVVFPENAEKEAEVGDETAAEPQKEEEAITNEAVTPTIPTIEETGEETVLKLAKSLAEIFGTFTNKDKEPYKNLKDLKPYVTAKMEAWIDGKVAEAAAPTFEGPFYGMTTQAVSAGVLESTAASYKILVTCEREEITEVTKSPKKFYQLIEMNFVKEGEDWKLDGAYWQ